MSAVSAVDDLSDPMAPDVADDPTPEQDGPPRPSSEPLGEPEPYYLREWRGSSLFGCPDCGYTGRSTGAVDRHRAESHPSPPDVPVNVRARRAGIILPTGH